MRTKCLLIDGRRGVALVIMSYRPSPPLHNRAVHTSIVDQDSRQCRGDRVESHAS